MILGYSVSTINFTCHVYKHPSPHSEWNSIQISNDNNHFSIEISSEVKARKINICQGAKYRGKFYIPSVDSSVKAKGWCQPDFLSFIRKMQYSGLTPVT